MTTRIFKGARTASGICSVGICSEPGWPDETCTRDIECVCHDCVNQACAGCDYGEPCRDLHDCLHRADCNNGSCDQAPIE